MAQDASTLKAHILAEISAHKADSAYQNDEAENVIFDLLEMVTGFNAEYFEEDAEYLRKANAVERLEFALKILNEEINASRALRQAQGGASATNSEKTGIDAPEII